MTQKGGGFVTQVVDLIKTTNTSVLQILTRENRICFSLMIQHDPKRRPEWHASWFWSDVHHPYFFLYVPPSFEPMNAEGEEQEKEAFKMRPRKKLPASQNLNSWYGKLLRMKYDEKLAEMMPVPGNPFYSSHFSDSVARSWVWCFGVPLIVTDDVLRRLQRGRNYAHPSSKGILPDLIWDALPVPLLLESSTLAL